MRYPFVLLTVLALVGSLHAQSSAEDVRLERVRRLAEAPGTARRTLVEGWLETAGLEFERMPFTSGKKSGTNLVVRLGGDEGPAVLVCAHHDARRGSKGSNNNASGVVVLLDLLKKLAATPPARPIVALFLDGGESGLTGSRAWVDAHGGERFLGAVVLEMCGKGDTVVLGPRRARVVNALPDDAAAALKALEEPPACRVLEDVPPTDHRVFASSALEVCALSIAPADQLDAITAKFARRRGTLPGIYKDAFTGFDRAAGVKSSALSLASRAAEAVIRAVAGRQDGGRPLVPGLLARQKALATVLAEEKLDGQLAEIGALGPIGAIPALSRLARGEDEDAAERAVRLLGRVLSGAELRNAIPPGAGTKEILEGLRATHRQLRWDEGKRAFALQP